MTPIDITLSPSEELTDLVVGELTAAPPDEWERVIDRLVRAHPDRREAIYGTAELHRQLTGAAPAVPPRVLRAGDRLGAFHITRLLRRGGMGEVYLADQPALDRRVAVKVIRRGFVSPTARTRFVQEQQVLARLHQSNIVPVHFAGEEGGLQYCVMHLVDGVPLDELIAAARRPHAPVVSPAASTIRQLIDTLPTTVDPARAIAPEGRAAIDPAPADTPHAPPPAYFAEAADLVGQVADALQHGHDKGICHRDVKPSNLMVERDGKCWVLDFGLAGVVNREGGPGAAGADAWQTTHGGTAQYMPPEQFDGRTDPRSDVYSLGLVLYELLALRPAVAGGEWKDVRNRAERDEPTDLRTLVPTVPADMAAIVRKATAKDPAGRYQTAAALAADLRRWRRGEPTVALPRTALERLWMWAKRNPAWASAIGAGLTTLLAIALVLILGAQVREARAKEQAAKEHTEREKADEEKRQAEKERDRIAVARKVEQAVVETQRLLLTLPQRTNWPGGIQEKLRDIQEIRPNEDLRDLAVETLVGLDLKWVYPHDVAATNDGRHTGFGSVAYRPDGQSVVIGGWWQPGGWASSAAVWDGNLANKPVETTRVGAGPVAFPDADSPLTLIPALGGRQSDFRPLSMAVAGGGAMLAPGRDTSLILWNVGKHKAVAELPLPGPGEVSRSALSADARFAAAVFYPPTKLLEKPKPVTLLWAIDRKARTAAKVGEWPGVATALAFSPDGQLLAVGTDDGEVIARTTADRVEVLRFQEGDLAVSGLGFGRNFRRPSGKRKEELNPAAGWLLGVGSQGGNLSVWDLRSKARLNSFRGSEHAVFGMSFSPDGTTLVSSGRFYPHIWDVATGQPLLRVTQPGRIHFRNWTDGVVFSPSGEHLAFASRSVFGPGGFDVFRVENGRGVRTYRGLAGVAEWTWLSPDGKHVAALAQNWQLGVWERESGRAKFVWDTPAGWTADNAAVGFDGESVVFASGRHATRWSLVTGERTDSWELPLGVNDQFVIRPDKPPLLVRRDPVYQPDFAIRGRELRPNGQLSQVYRVKEDWKDWRLWAITPAGHGLAVVPPEGKTSMRFLLFDAKTGAETPVKFDTHKGLLINTNLSGQGKLFWMNSSSGPDDVRTYIVRASDGARIATHPLGLDQVDEAGKLGIVDDKGVRLYRIGEDRPLVTFDRDRLANGHSLGISPDGRFVYWGRRDGTVCVADVNQCLEQLAPFGKR